MRRGTSILLLTFYTLVILQPLLPRLLFSMNQTYIQQELCVQRENVSNTCKGACFMRKKLQADQESNAPLRAMLIAQAEVVQLIPEAKTVLSFEKMTESRPVPSFDKSPIDQFVGDLPVPPPWA
ncbi:MAG: hypothetical protein RLZZ519_3044 [Bacteroidota bacterium]|jgi:hypothetical protein